MSGDTLIVTQVGLDNSTNAALHGVSIVLNSFKVGSAFGYTPSLSDTALHGSILYSGGINSYTRDSQGNLVVSLNINPTAGPFQFGEVGIYRDDGSLFALMSFPDLQNKYSSLGNNIASTFNFTCYLRLGQAGGVIDIVAGGGGSSTVFNYVLHTGQPTALWGTNDGGTTNEAWNPSNFNVATSTGISSLVTGFYNAEGHVWHRSDGTTVLASLDTSGVFTAANVGATSDITLKENIEYLDDQEALKAVMKMLGIRYSLISDPTHRRFIGFNAQKIQEFLPEVVTSFKDLNDEEKLSLMYGNFAALFSGAIRNINQRLAKVESYNQRY